ncbi:MAG: hypothetical protein PWP65_1526 [Clostridia bacterium]|nr:hypothetical protein [Clostridia bacterium]
MGEQPVLVSACLLGFKCKYNGGHNAVPDLIKMHAEGRAVPVCPEQLGGLPTPRPPAEIQGGEGRDVLSGRARVKDREGKDVTEAFIRGAMETLKLAQKINARVAILKEKSPSCGSTQIYDGTFTGQLQPGAGVTAALLTGHGLKVYSEKTYPALKRGE